MKIYSFLFISYFGKITRENYPKIKGLTEVLEEL